MSLIPHTAKETTLGLKKEGDQVNLETDIIGKYVERMLHTAAKAADPDAAPLSKETLFENGFL